MTSLADALAVWTAGASGKIKRIRRNGAVTAAEVYIVEGRLPPVRGAVRREYGLLGLVLTTPIPLRSRGRGEAGVAITLA